MSPWDAKPTSTTAAFPVANLMRTSITDLHDARSQTCLASRPRWISGPGGERLLRLSCCVSGSAIGQVESCVFTLVFVMNTFLCSRSVSICSHIRGRFPKHMTQQHVDMQNLEVKRRRQLMREVCLCICVCVCVCVCVRERTPADVWAHRQRYSIAAALLIL